MKKTILLFSAMLTLLFISCTGPEGPRGDDGYDGSEFEAAAFEIEENLLLNTTSNTYEIGNTAYPSYLKLLPDDVILIYRLEEIDNETDVWRQLPQPFLTDEGLVFYNFDFTQGDYNIYLESEYDASLVTNDLVTNQVFRIVVIPAKLGASSKTDKSNISSVLNSLGISENDIHKIN